MLCATLLRHKIGYSRPAGLNSTSIRVGFDQVRKTGHLTPKESALLRYLVSQDGRVVPHRELLAAVWGSKSVNRSNYLHVFMTNLRKKIEPDPGRPQYIETVPCVGYSFSVTAGVEESSSHD